MKVSYQHVEPDGTFVFHAADGSEIVVAADKPYVTDDAGVVAYLDQTPFVQRVASKQTKGADS